MQASPEQAQLNSCVLSTGPGTEEWLLNAEGVNAMHENVSVCVHPGTTTTPKGHCSHPQGHAPAEGRHPFLGHCVPAPTVAPVGATSAWFLSPESRVGPALKEGEGEALLLPTVSEAGSLGRQRPGENIDTADGKATSPNQGKANHECSLIMFFSHSPDKKA